MFKRISYFVRFIMLPLELQLAEYIDESCLELKPVGHQFIFMRHFSKLISVQCFDTVGWATERASGL